MSLAAAYQHAARPKRHLPTEQILNDKGIKFELREDGTYIVPGDVDFSGGSLPEEKKLRELPDLSRVHVKGSFLCFGNLLTSLKGAPAHVGKTFSCSNNQLTSLEDGPKTVSGGYFCNNNRLTTLKGAPRVLKEGFNCISNHLTSLEHGPDSVGGDFACSFNKLNSLMHGPSVVGNNYFCNNNNLSSLRGAPATFEGDSFYCQGNPLLSLFHAPRSFWALESDFGKFSSYAEIPVAQRRDIEKENALKSSGSCQTSMESDPDAIRIRRRTLKI